MIGLIWARKSINRLSPEGGICLEDGQIDNIAERETFKSISYRVLKSRLVCNVHVWHAGIIIVSGKAALRV